ncbi:MAG: hypothetical protein ABI401_07000 [Candidatus Dormibacter sp.]
MVKRAVLCLLIAAVLPACAGGPLAAPQPGTVSGHVSTRACGGAAREVSSGCLFHPAAGMTLAFRPVAGGQASFATTDARGFYSITLPAGEYQVDPKDPIPSTSRAGAHLLKVTAGHPLTADLSYTLQLL